MSKKKKTATKYYKQNKNERAYMVITIIKIREKKSKAISVTGREGLQGCEMLRIPRCLDNRLIDGGKVVSPTHRPHSPETFFFLVLISVRG
jgi:hypothetical protein